MPVYSKFGETAKINYDPAVVKADAYGVNSGSAPTAPTFPTVSGLFTPLAASYEAVSGSAAVPVIGSINIPAQLEIRAHRSAGSETWVDLTMPSDGKTFNTTFTVASNTGWAIEIRVKATQAAVWTSTSFDVA